MPAAIRETIQVLELIVQGVPIGTNLGLLYMLWALLNGSFLSSRGAICPALPRSGFNAETSRRSWSAFRYGAWTIEKLILSYLAAVLPPMPTGFWDRRPKKHQAAYAGSWPKPIFSLSMKNLADFAKRTRSHGTYPKALTAIAAKKRYP